MHEERRETYSDNLRFYKADLKAENLKVETVSQQILEEISNFILSARYTYIGWLIPK